MDGISEIVHWLRLDTKKIELLCPSSGEDGWICSPLEKGEQSGYSPAYEFNWDESWRTARGGSIKDFENKKLLPLRRCD